MARSKATEITREQIRVRLAEHCTNNPKDKNGVLGPIVSSSQLTYISKFQYVFGWSDGALIHDMLTGNSTAAFVGSYTATVNATGIDCCRKRAKLHFVGVNETGMTSLTHMPVAPGEYSESLIKRNPFGDSGYMHSVTQTFEWDEEIAF